MRNKQYHILKKLAIFFLCGYFAVGMITNKLIPERYVFPFFSWDLFSQIPGKKTSYALLVRQQNKVMLLQNTHTTKAQFSATTYSLIQSMGLAVERHDKKEQQRLLHLLKENYLKPDTQYELIKITYDPIARFRNGRYKIVAHLERF